MPRAKRSASSCVFAWRPQPTRPTTDESRRASAWAAMPPAAPVRMAVIVPVDGMSSEDLYYEQATAWLLAKGTGGIGPKVTLTRSDMIKF